MNKTEVKKRKKRLNELGLMQNPSVEYEQFIPQQDPFSLAEKTESRVPGLKINPMASGPEEVFQAEPKIVYSDGLQTDPLGSKPKIGEPTEPKYLKTATVANKLDTLYSKYFHRGYEGDSPSIKEIKEYEKNLQIFNDGIANIKKEFPSEFAIIKETNDRVTAQVKDAIRESENVLPFDTQLKSEAYLDKLFIPLGSEDDFGSIGGTFLFDELKDTEVGRTIVDGSQGDPKSYTVKSGDTLGSIATENNIDLDVLVKANKIENPNLIREGQQLIIPTPFVYRPQEYEGALGQYRPDDDAMFVGGGDFFGETSQRGLNKKLDTYWHEALHKADLKHLVGMNVRTAHNIAKKAKEEGDYEKYARFSPRTLFPSSYFQNKKIVGPEVIAYSMDLLRKYLSPDEQVRKEAIESFSFTLEGRKKPMVEKALDTALKTIVLFYKTGEFEKTPEAQKTAKKALDRLEALDLEKWEENSKNAGFLQKAINYIFGNEPPEKISEYSVQDIVPNEDRTDFKKVFVPEEVKNLVDIATLITGVNFDPEKGKTVFQIDRQPNVNSSEEQKVEEDKKEVKEMNKGGGLMKTEAGEKMKEKSFKLDRKKADLNKDGKLSPYEKVRGEAIQKSIKGMNCGGMMSDPFAPMQAVVGVEIESGNEIPAGSLPEEVADDIPTMLSEGEYVVPADVVRYHGLKTFESLRGEAKMGLAMMHDHERIQTVDEEGSVVTTEEEEEEVAEYREDVPSENVEVEIVKAAEGTDIQRKNQYRRKYVRLPNGTFMLVYVDPETGETISKSEFEAEKSTRYAPVSNYLQNQAINAPSQNTPTTTPSETETGIASPVRETFESSNEDEIDKERQENYDAYVEGYVAQKDLEVLLGKRTKESLLEDPLYQFGVTGEMSFGDSLQGLLKGAGVIIGMITNPALTIALGALKAGNDDESFSTEDLNKLIRKYGIDIDELGLLVDTNFTKRDKIKQILETLEKKAEESPRESKFTIEEEGNTGRDKTTGATIVSVNPTSNIIGGAEKYEGKQFLVGFEQGMIDPGLAEAAKMITTDGESEFKVGGGPLLGMPNENNTDVSSFLDAQSRSSEGAVYGQPMVASPNSMAFPNDSKTNTDVTSSSESTIDKERKKNMAFPYGFEKNTDVTPPDASVFTGVSLGKPNEENATELIEARTAAENFVYDGSGIQLDKDGNPVISDIDSGMSLEDAKNQLNLVPDYDNVSPFLDAQSRSSEGAVYGQPMVASPFLDAQSRSSKGAVYGQPMVTSPSVSRPNEITASYKDAIRESEDAARVKSTSFVDRPTETTASNIAAKEAKENDNEGSQRRNIVTDSRGNAVRDRQGNPVTTGKKEETSSDSDDSSCAIATYAQRIGSDVITKRDKRKAEIWCIRTYHGSWWGEAIRRGYQHVAGNEIKKGRGETHFQSFLDYVDFGRGTNRNFDTGYTFITRTVEFFIKGLTVARKGK